MPARLGVVWDRGAASPLAISDAARNICQVVFLADSSTPHVAQNKRVLAAAGEVCDTSGLNTQAICQVAEDRHLTHITTFSEERLAQTAAVAGALGLEFHEPGTVNKLRDKGLQRDALAIAGIPIPRYALLTEPSGSTEQVMSVGLPVVLKPRLGAGSRDTFLITNKKTLSRIDFKSLMRVHPTGLIAEGMIIGDASVAGEAWGDYVSVESAVVNGRVHGLAVTGKLPLAYPFRESGMIFPSTIKPGWRDPIYELNGRAVRAVGVISGMCHTEVKLTPNGPRVIEVNGRLGGYVGELVRRATGHNLVRSNIMAILGLEPDRVGPASKVAFDFFLLPPYGARRFVGFANEPSRLTGLPRADSIAFEARKQPGEYVDWREGTEGYVARCWGSCSDHESVLVARDEAVTRLRPVYER